MPNFVVSMAFDVKDKGSLNHIQKLTKGTKKFGDVADSSFGKASRSALGFKGVVGGILTAGVISKGINQLQNGVRSLTDEFIEFDRAITSAAAKLDVKRGTQSFRLLEQAARDVGAETEYSATNAAVAIDELVKAGFSQAQAMKAVRGTTDLATIANIGLEQSSAIAVGALNAFGLASDDSEQRLKNLTRINDVFSRTVNSSATDIEALNETMIQSAPIFEMLGSDLETFAAMAGAVAKANLKGSMAGTTLKQSMQSLVSITPKAQKVFDKLRIQTINKLTGDLKDPIQLMAEFADATKNMGTGIKGAAIDTVFGRRALAGVSKILKLGGGWLRQYREETIGMGRSAKDVADDMRKSIGNRLKVLQSTAIETGFKFIDAFKDKIPGAVDVATEAIRGFDVKEVFSALSRVKNTVKNLLLLAKDLGPIIWGVVAAFTAYRTILIAIVAIKAIQSMIALASAIKAAAAAQGLLNLAMTANPIGVIVVAIGVLTAAIIAVYKNWDYLKAAFLDSGFWRLLQAFGGGIAIIFRAIGKQIKKLWKGFNDLLDNPFFAALATLFTPLLTIPALIIKHWSKVKNFFSGLGSTIKGAVSYVSDAFGFGGKETPSKKGDIFAAPNAKIEQAKLQQTLDVSGQMTFVNPPKDAEFKSDFFKAPRIEHTELGYN